MNPQCLIYLDPALDTAINMSSTGERADSIKKGPKAQFSTEDVIMIKLFFHVHKMKYREIAEKYNVDYQTIYCIINKKSYKEVRLNYMTKIPEKFHEETDGIYRDIKIKGHN